MKKVADGHRLDAYRRVDLIGDVNLPVVYSSTAEFEKKRNHH